MKKKAMIDSKNQDYELLANIATPLSRVAFMERLAGLGYWELDVKHRKIYCSEEIYHILGADTDLRNSLSLRKVMSETAYQKFFTAIRKLYHHQEKIRMELHLLPLNGGVRACQLRGDFFCIRDNTVIAGTLQDLSEMIDTKNQLIKARNLAEKLNKDKSYFLAQASHDLRQPLHALSMYVDLFCPKNLTSAQLKLWNKIKQTSESLKSLLNNVLDLSKLDYGGTKVHKSSFNIGMLLSDLGHEFTALAECQNLVFEYTICNCRLNNDAFLVERILRNLLSNAFKFAAQKVTIDCREKKGFVFIDVVDDGIGIPLEDQRHIFEEFYRGKNAYENMTDGAGLGLAIVKKISKLIGAKVKVSSTAGQGSRFTLILKK